MRTFLITGADKGIGEALCEELAARGHTPIAACLEQGETLRARGIEVIPRIDVTSDAAMVLLGRQLDGRPIDVLIHNAGIVIESGLGQFDFAAFHREYDINALGPLRVTQVVLPLLSKGSKIAVITSRVGSLGENTSGGLYGYRMSKAAGNMAGLCLARDLAKNGIAVICLHPGSVRSDFIRGLKDTTTVGKMIDPQVAARGLLDRIDELTLDTSGTFRHANGDMLPW